MAPSGCGISLPTIISNHQQPDEPKLHSLHIRVICALPFLKEPKEIRCWYLRELTKNNGRSGESGGLWK